jgi:prolyl-tRNA synthetase
MFLRTSEFLWQEGHTAHATAADATAETTLALGFYQDVAVQTAALATVPGEKTPGERFAGAERTFTLEAMMRDGRALQAGTSHFMGTNFAAAFGITYTSESGTAELCHTTSWGMTTRMIGALIMTHGDDQGLVLPPALAPYQVVIVPIGRGDQAQATVSAAAELAATLQRAGIRTHVDDRPQLSPGFKFNDWEMRGVPLRLELGPRDLAAGTALLARRLSYRQPDAAAKEAIPLDAAPGLLAAELAAFQAMLARRAADFRDDHTAVVNSWPEFTAAVAAGWALALACGDQACEDEIKAETTATPRCIPLDGEPEQGPCIRCGKPSAYGKRLIFARAY